MSVNCFEWSIDITKTAANERITGYLTTCKTTFSLGHFYLMKPKYALFDANKQTLISTIY